MELKKLINTKSYLKAGVNLNTVLSVFKAFDRLPDNPYFPSENYVAKVLDSYGYLPLFVFVCPKIRPKYLVEQQKELFMFYSRL